MEKTFDYLLINFHEGAKEEIVIRGYIAGGSQRRFVMLLSELQKPDFLRRAYERGMNTGESIGGSGNITCPVCGTRKGINHKVYKGNRFCGQCGAQYRLVGGNVELIAAANDS